MTGIFRMNCYFYVVKSDLNKAYFQYSIWAGKKARIYLK